MNLNLNTTTLGFDKIYVINLKRRTDRKKNLITQYPNIDFTFIDAIDGKKLFQSRLLEEKLINTSFYDPSGMITMGVFACALSHKKAWDQALKDGVKNALFLEDDIFFPFPLLEGNSNFSPLYQEILQEINEIDYDLVHLGKKTPTQSGLNIGKHLTVPRFNTNHHGAHAYVATKKMIQTLSDNYLPIKYAADVYLEQFYNSHNIITLKNSIIRQLSDIGDSSNADSDTYYNDYREGGGLVGISFDEKGNVLNKQIAKYIKHPQEMLTEYTEIVLERPKFGVQKFTLPSDKPNPNFFGMSKLLIFLSENLDSKNSNKMVEINSHLGENTFLFGCSNLFSNIYTIDPYSGEDKFNVDNNLTWADVKVGYHSNTYFFDKTLSNLPNHPEDVVDSFDNNSISFCYINNRNKEDISFLINLYYPKLKSGGFIGGDNFNSISNLPTDKAITFEDNSWLLKKEDIDLTKIKNINLLKFKEQGYIHLKNIIEPNLLSLTRDLSIDLKHKYKEFEGQPRENGSGKFWKGLEMASTLDTRLYDSYTSPTMLELAKTYLEVEEPYLFNDQVVVKLPNDDFTFSPHFDNQYGPNPEAALRGEFKTINCCQILTDMDLETGPLSCLNLKTNTWDTLPAKAGDIVIIDGNTLHSSTANTSDNVRVLYACVYSTHPIGDFQEGYYNEKFKIDNI